MIKSTFTATAMGDIYHKEYDGILCPVRLVRKGRGIVQSDTRSGLPVPEMMLGKFVFALPGGGSFVPED